ncbi:LON peptidase substrate-binding domain-containing protein [Acidipila sp. EB88]|uniref:LON peptidase substrate-binding domain-containing protein n=1 Tax=Acidipila sp. EB88 TaxID=2305226 RepID=UPI000F5D995D|nr:LON peptidase substrate-binding domain-containing protein [Acidipila sp. EB88]RRA47783.1 ATP-dependent protease La domain-containing protein [Acidipila sp. EB88]
MKIALFPLDVVLFPGVPLPLHIFEPRYKEMIQECLTGELQFGVVRAQREGLAIAGCTATVTRVIRSYPDGRVDVLCEGGRRFEIEQLDNSRSFLQAEVDFFDDEDVDTAEASREERAACVALHLEVLALAGIGRESYSLDLDKQLSFQLAWELPADLGFKQELLVSRSDRERTERLKDFYEGILPKLRLGAQARPAYARNGHGPVM